MSGTVITLSSNFAKLKTKTIFGTDQGVHKHDILVDKMHSSEGVKMLISSKLDFY